MAEADWVDIGSAEELAGAPLRKLAVRNRELAVSFQAGRFGVVSNACNHVGGPLGDGRLDGDYITCPWHNWKFHRCTGKGEPGYEEDAVPAYAVKVEAGRVLVDMASATRRSRAPHPPHRHAHEELAIVREGALEVSLEGQEMKIVSAGGLVYAASNQMHGWKNAGDTRASYFVIALGRKG